MRTQLTLVFLLVALMRPASAQGTTDTWVMTDGRMFQAELIQAAPGELKVRLSDGKEESLLIEELSELSKKRAAERLGLGGTAVAPKPATTPSSDSPPVVEDKPATPAPTPAAPPAMTGVSAEGVISILDTAAIDAAMGTEITVSGVVKEVATLGSAGHKKVVFEGASAVVFVGKWDLDKSGDWKFDGLEGERLQVTGEVDKYNDELQVQPASPNGMRVLPAAE